MIAHYAVHGSTGLKGVAFAVVHDAVFSQIGTLFHPFVYATVRKHHSIAGKNSLHVSVISDLSLSRMATTLPLGDPSAPLTIREKLLFSQAVHQSGAGPSRWPAVRQLLEECPVVKREEGYFDDETCSGIYEGLMRESGAEE